MNDLVRDDVYSYLSEEKVNIDLIFDWDEDRGLLINARARPWKNSANDGRMVLAAGRTVDEALLWTVRGLLNNRWIPLNWSRRCREIGIDKRLAPIREENQVRRNPTLAQELFTEPSESNDTNDQENGLHKGSHVVQKKNKLVQSELPGIS
jgi:hypothetical protein